jgi:hypothetical protein
MPPGNYTVRLTVDGREVSAPLEVRKDPNTGGSVQEIAAQTRTLTGLRDALNTTVDMVNQIEVTRAQLEMLRRLIADDSAAADVRAATDSLEAKLKAVENDLQQLRLTGRGQDGVRWPAGLATKLTYVANGIASSDFAPTTQQEEVSATLIARVRERREALDRVVRQDLAAFNQMLARRNLRSIIMQ